MFHLALADKTCCRHFAKLLLSTNLAIWVSNPSPRIWPKQHRRCPVIGIGTSRKFLARVKGRIKEKERNTAIEKTYKKNCILERGRISVKRGEAHYVRHSLRAVPVDDVSLCLLRYLSPLEVESVEHSRKSPVLGRFSHLSGFTAVMLPGENRLARKYTRMYRSENSPMTTQWCC